MKFQNFEILIENARKTNWQPIEMLCSTDEETNTNDEDDRNQWNEQMIL